ncbi:hypothetical protein [Phyllobacterium endophyticum]|uniref:hypothetical protein n=1 Tax=Phyllobacterium endophyticum TaxID=1149773 RepID=UPI001650273A|nr:hypothetical protein [Phyllobacterium endophyticum]
MTTKRTVTTSMINVIDKQITRGVFKNKSDACYFTLGRLSKKDLIAVKRFVNSFPDHS